jgi:hypothetical protein
MKRARYALGAAWLVASFFMGLVTPGSLMTSAPAHAADAPAYTSFGGPAYGFLVSVPADWPRQVSGSAAREAELDAAGPPDSGTTLLVGQQPAGSGQTPTSLLPAGSRILRQADLALPWAKGVTLTLQRNLKTAAGAEEQRTELHAVLSTGTRLFHVAVAVAQSSWVGQQGAAQALYHTLLQTLTPFLYPAPVTPEGTMLAYWSAVGRHDGKAAYQLLSVGLRRTMAGHGAGPAALTTADRHILALKVDKWQAITPAKALAGPDREYMLVLRLHVSGVTSWDEGLNVRYVRVVPGTETPWAIGEIAVLPIPL